MRLELDRLELPGLAEPLSLTVRVSEVRAIVVAEPPLARAMADAITGLAVPSAGRVTVRVNSDAPDDAPDDGRRDGLGDAPDNGRIALVPADGALLPHLTVLRNIMYPSLASRRQRVGAESRIRAKAGEFGLEGVLDRYPYEISLGQRRMAGLARSWWSARPRYEAFVLEDSKGMPTWGALLEDSRSRGQPPPDRAHTPRLLVDVATLLIVPTVVGAQALDVDPIVATVA